MVSLLNFRMVFISQDGVIQERLPATMTHALKCFRLEKKELVTSDKLRWKSDLSYKVQRGCPVLCFPWLQ